MLIKGFNDRGNRFTILPIDGYYLFKTNVFYVKKLFIKIKKNT
jgi:hypothetical protein